MASDTWSAILSGWPSVTDSEVKRKRSLNEKLLPLQGIQFGQPGARTGRSWITGATEQLSATSDPLPRKDMPAPSGLRLGMHPPMVIAGGGVEQNRSLNGEWGA